MDLVDIAVEKKFLGQEFLTWLWWASDTEGGVHTDVGTIAVEFNGRLQLEDAEGTEKVTCVGEAELPEALTGLVFSKKIQQARITLTAEEDLVFSLALTGDLFEYKSVKLPKTVPAAGGDSEEEASEAILERVYLFKKLRDVVHALFKAFLTVRLSDEWASTRQEIRDWSRSED